MFLSDLQNKDIVSIIDGKNLGRIIDVELDNSGKVINILVEKRRFFRRFFSSSSQVTFSYSDIEKIGSDVILIKI